MDYALGAKVKYDGRVFVVRKIFTEGEHAGKIGIRLFRRVNWEPDYLRAVSPEAVTPYDAAAEKAAKTKDQMTCQICARLIHAAHGVIAHHGYSRPSRGSGWQTASCLGARFAPYEVSRERIGEVRDDMVIPQLEAQRELLTGFRADPVRHVPGPEVDTGRVDHHGKRIRNRPPIGPDHGEYDRYRTYLDRELERNVKDTEDFLAHLVKRWDDWKPQKLQQAS
jgi:hypothetical protein